MVYKTLWIEQIEILDCLFDQSVVFAGSIYSWAETDFLFMQFLCLSQLETVNYK